MPPSSLHQFHTPSSIIVSWKLALLMTLVAVSSTTSSAASPVGRGWTFPHTKLTTIISSKRCRNNKSIIHPMIASSSDHHHDKSYMLDESDFEDEDEDDYDDYWGPSDGEESVISRIANSCRGGGAAAATNSRINLPGIHSGWRKKKKQQTRKNNSSSATKKLQRMKQQQMQQLESIQQQKMRQIRRIFKQKQRQFQISLYNLNSRINYNFPKPPYSLWQLDNEPGFGKTTLTGKIFLLNIAMFGLQTIYPQITALGAKRSDMIMEGRQLHRLLTPIFLHGGIGHLMANSYSLKSMGVNVERAFGQPRLLATYVVSGIAGNVLSAIQSPNPAVGASGAIFGLVGAYYTFLSRNQELFGYAGHMQKSALIETIGINLLLGTVNPMIDNWGHIGGFIGGVGMAWLIGPKLYVARIPIGSDENGFGAGKVVIDRPTLTFRTPYFLDEGMYSICDNAKKLGRRINTSVRNLLNSDVQEYYLDKYVDISGGNGVSTGDGTIYRTLKEDIQLEGNVNVSPSDGLRQDVSELDPTIVRQREKRQQQQRRRAPKAGSSIRPRYGHLYR